MAIVRELVTLLKYDVDRSGIDEYSSALKKLAGWVGGLFAAHEIMEIADEWNTVAGRVLNVTNSITEQTRVMDLLQAQAESTGQSFEGIGSLFAQLKTTGSSLNYTTDQVLQLTSAISQLTTLGGGTAAGGKRGMIQIEEMFSLGVVQMQHLKALMIDIPGALDVISTGMEGGKKKFMEMVHAGTMTSKMFGDLFLKSQGEIERRFKNMPLTFARAFETVHSFIGRLIYDIGKASSVWTTMAAGIIGGARAAVNAVRWLADTVGGFTNLLKTVAILAAAAFGASTLMKIGALITAIRTLSVAGFMAAAPWYLLAALIAAALLIAEDVYVWMQGGESVIGGMIGSYKEWRSTIESIKPIVEALAIGFAALWVGARVSGIIGGFTTLATVTLPAVAGGIEGVATAIGVAQKSALGLLGTWGLILAAVAAIAILAKLGSAAETPENREKIERNRRERGNGLGPTTLEPQDGYGPDGMPLVRPQIKPGANGMMIPMFDDSTRDQQNVAPPLGKDWLSGLLTSVLPAWVTGGMPAPSIVPPAAMIPHGAQTTTINSSVTNNITATSDTPQAIGDAAAKGTKSGLSDGLGRSLGIMSPAVEFGLGY